MAVAGTLAAIFMVARGFASELHPVNRAARNRTRQAALHRHGGPDDRPPMSLALAACADGCVQVAGVIAATPMLPSPSQMVHAPTIAARLRRRRSASIALMMLLQLLVGGDDRNREPHRDDGAVAGNDMAVPGSRRGARLDRRSDSRREHRGYAIDVCIAAVLLIFRADVRARRAPASKEFR